MSGALSVVYVPFHAWPEIKCVHQGFDICNGTLGSERENPCVELFELVLLGKVKGSYCGGVEASGLTKIHPIGCQGWWLRATRCA